MKKHHNVFIEHYLVPAALFLLNICLVHVVYVYSAGSMYSLESKAILTLVLLAMAGSLAFKKKGLLVSSIFFYAIVVIAFLMTGTNIHAPA